MTDTTELHIEGWATLLLLATLGLCGCGTRTEVATVQRVIPNATAEYGVAVDSAGRKCYLGGDRREWPDSGKAIICIWREVTYE